MSFITHKNKKTQFIRLGMGCVFLYTNLGKGAETQGLGNFKLRIPGGKRK